MVWLVNKLLKPFGRVVVDLAVMDELIMMMLAHRTVLQAQLKPDQVLVYDMQTHRVTIEQIH